MRAKHTALLLSAGFLFMPTLLWSQLPGGLGGGSGGVPGSGRSRMFSDPDQLFDQYSRDGRTLRKEDLPQNMQMMLDFLGPQLGLTGTQWTRDDLRQSTERLRERFQAGGFQFNRGGGAAPGGPAPGALGGSGDGDRRLDDRFQRRDRDQDGVLSNDELPEELQAERKKYDLNHDGKIDLNEYRGYVTARIGDARPGAEGQRDRGAGRGDPDAAGDDERKRPTILRAGSLPPDFPYAGLDTNADGQIGLYEWKAAGSRVADFLAMDPNNDGFLTVEEYYGWRKQQMGEAASGSRSAEFARGGGPGGMMMGMGGGRGGMPGGMMGMGGGRGPGGPGGFAMGGGGFGGGRGMDMMGRGAGGGGFGFGGGAMGFGGGGRGPGGPGGSGGGMGMGGGMIPGAFTPQGGGMGFRGAGMGGAPGPGMGGDRGARMGGEDRGPGGRGPGGRGGEGGGDRPDRPRKDRDR